jgi:hypothetical protein
MTREINLAFNNYLIENNRLVPHFSLTLKQKVYVVLTLYIFIVKCNRLLSLDFLIRDFSQKTSNEDNTQEFFIPVPSPYLSKGKKNLNYGDIHMILPQGLLYKTTHCSGENFLNIMLLNSTANLSPPFFSQIIAKMTQ